MKLPDYVQIALKLLEKSGYTAVVVGGAVRDFLLGKVAHDFDVSTSANPVEIKNVFNKYYQLDFGIKHGTITVFINHNKIEITSFRTEEDYEDYRHPKKVSFVRDLSLDLNRRDFSINALCYNKELIDLVDGKKDLDNKIIRAIGDVNLRFTEDALRIIRALRFASTLGFNIEEETRKAIFKHKNLLRNISRERINSEFNKFIMGEYVFDVFTKYFNIILEFIPELKDSINLNTNLSILKVINNKDLRLALLFSDFDKDTILKILSTLKFSNNEVKEISFYAINLSNIFETFQDVLDFLKYNSNERFFDLIDLMIKVRISRNNDFNKLLEFKKKVEYYIEKNVIFRISELAIDGNDLIRIGFTQGISIKYLLEEIVENIICEKLKNKREELLDFANDKIKID